MYNTNDREFIEEVKKDLSERLDNYKDIELSDIYSLGDTLTESERADGSWYCDTYKAEQDVAGHFELFGDLAAKMEIQYGSSYNVFLETERFHLDAMLTLYDTVWQAATANLEIELDTLDDETISKFREALDKVDESVIEDDLEYYANQYLNREDDDRNR